MELLEREPQLMEVNAALKGVLDGEGAIVLVGGEAGIGKNLLCHGSSRVLPAQGASPVGCLRSTLEMLWGHLYWVLPNEERKDSASALKFRASANCPCLSPKSARDASALAKNGYILDWR